MKSFFFFMLSVVLTRSQLSDFDIASIIKPCKIDSPDQDDCIKVFLEKLFTSSEMDPYVISSYSAELPKNGVVDGTLDLKDIRMSGIRDAEFIRVAARIERPNFILGMHFSIPSFSFTFNSTSELLKGVYRGNLTDGEIKVKLTGTIESEDEGDLEYIKINDTLVILAFEEFEQDLSDIEDGLLRDILNLYVDDWRDLYDKNQANITSVLQEHLTSTVNEMYSKIPFKDMFVD